MTLLKLASISCGILCLAFLLAESRTTRRRNNYHKQEYYYEVIGPRTTEDHRRLDPSAFNFSVDGQYYLTSCPSKTQWFLCVPASFPLCLLNGTIACVTEQYSRCPSGFCTLPMIAGPYTARVRCISFAKVWDWEHWLPSSNITLIRPGLKKQDYKEFCVTTLAQPKKRDKKPK